MDINAVQCSSITIIQIRIANDKVVEICIIRQQLAFSTIKLHRVYASICHRDIKLVIKYLHVIDPSFVLVLDFKYCILSFIEVCLNNLIPQIQY